MEIKKGIFWTGYIDWDLREFHGYSTPHGSTYNAYLLLDEHPTLIDTVKHYGFSEMLAQIRRLIDPAKIEYIVSNHTEMDHSGSLSQVVERIGNPKTPDGVHRGSREGDGFEGGRRRHGLFELDAVKRERQTNSEQHGKR